jgi:hypothetical protein
MMPDADNLTYWLNEYAGECRKDTEAATREELAAELLRLDDERIELEAAKDATDPDGDSASHCDLEAWIEWCHKVRENTRARRIAYDTLLSTGVQCFDYHPLWYRRVCTEILKPEGQ